MSREQPISQAEEGSFLILVPPLHKRDCSCQYGSSNAFDLSEYVCIDKRSRLDQDHCTFLEKIEEEYTNKTDAGLEWEVLAHQQQSALSLEEDSRLSIYSGSIPGIGGGELRRMGKSVSESLAKASAVNTLDCSHGYKSKCELSVVSQRGWHSDSHLVSGQNEEVLWCNYWKLLSRGFQLAPQAKEPDMESPIINLYGQSLDEKGLILPSSKYREVDVEEPERLAEALCHSQTRARNAEKQATDALTDKARLVKLLDREAISCHAYKERVRLLEVENSWLKACPNHKKVELPGIQNASKMGPHCKFYKQGMSNKSTLEPTTVGLAFALGLSCASVGFMVGCCMGLIGFSK